ncbi:MAG TPA: BamA/TamA family outer membrane protein [Candidatus Eisenbacteria bacterium]
MRPRTASAALAPLAALLAALALTLPAGALAQSGGELPEQLRVIAGVRFRGVKHLSRRELKAANLKTRNPSRLPWRERPSLRLDYLRADTAAIAALYRHYGYLDARAHWEIKSARDPAAARVVFVIEEGVRSRIANLTLEGVRAFHDRELQRVLLAQPGRPFDPAFLPIDTLHLSALYQERGYRPHTVASAERGVPDSLATKVRGVPESLRVAVRYRVSEGPRYTIGRIEYEGGGRLRESLARRELLVHPGDIYRRSRLELSVQRLYDTGLYSQVQVSSLTDTTAGQLDLFLRVAERRSRWVDLGVGSGSADLFRFTGAWGHRNLDRKALLGSLNGELALDRQRRDSQSETQVLRLRTGRGSANLVEPWLLGLRLQGQASLFYEQVSDDRDQRFLQRRDSRGFELGMLREFSRLFRGSLTAHSALVHQSYDVFLSVPGVSDSVQQAARDSLANEVLKRYYDNGLALSLLRDTRDDRITPSRGSLQTLIAEAGGGPLRGASSYQKLQLVSSWYSPRPNGWQFAARLSGGVMGPIGHAPSDFSPRASDSHVARVPRERRFYIGGVNSLRGFGENSIPGDGGLAMLLGNAEMRVPLAGPFGAEFFVDAGNVWARPEHVRLASFVAPWDARHGQPGDLRYSYGVGARLLLPFGPLRLDLAWSGRDDLPRSSLPSSWRRAPLPFAYQFAIGPSF